MRSDPGGHQSKRAGKINKQQRARGSSEQAPMVELNGMRTIVRRRSRSEIAARGGAKGDKFVMAMTSKALGLSCYIPLCPFQIP